MPLVTSSQFNLQPDISPITQQLLQAFHIGQQNKVEDQKQQDIKVKETAQRVGAQALHIRGMDDFRDRKIALTRIAQDMVKKGEDTTKIESLINIQDNDELGLALTQVGVGAADAEKFISDRLKPEVVKPKEFAQGTGVMSGYAFDKTTGTYSIDPATQQQLLVDAQSKAASEGMLDIKKIADVNDKVTALTKPVSSIVEAANSLEALKDRGSQASQIAAVFKFMKANDPTSTVRESELGMIYSAEGAMAGFANMLNSLIGKGRLSKTGFEDIVNTAKSLANSAVDSANDNVTGYLDVLKDKMPEKDYNVLLKRIPKKLSIGGAGGASDKDIIDTMKATGMTRREVIDELLRRAK